MGNIFGVMESSMTQFVDHLGDQKRQMISLKSKIEEIEKSVSGSSHAGSATSTPSTSSGAASEKQIKVLSDKLENISVELSKCLEAFKGAKSSSDSMEKNIAKISERLNTLEQNQRSQATKLTELGTSQTDSASKISKQLEVFASSSSSQPDRSTTLVSSKIEALEKEVKRLDPICETIETMNGNVKKCVSGLAELGAEMATLKASRPSAPLPTATKSGGALFCTLY
jgi:chromosome segregation ATPase